MTIRVNAFGKTIAFPAGTSPEDIEKHISSNRALLDPEYKAPETGMLASAAQFGKEFAQNSLGVDMGIDTSSQPTGQDYLKGFASGANKLVSGIGYLAEIAGAKDAGKSIREFGDRGAAYWNNLMSAGGKQAAADQVFEDDEDSITGLRLSDNWGNALLMGASQSAPSMFAAAVPGAMATSAIQKLASLGLAGGSGATIPLLAGTAAPVGIASNIIARTPAAIGFGSAEGITAGAMNAADLKSSIEGMPIEELRKSPVFSVLESEHGEDAARSLIAEQAASDVFGRTAVSTGAIGALTGGGALGQAYQKATGAAKGGILNQTIKGSAQEAVQEAPQSGMEKLIENVAVRDYLNPDQNIMEGVIAYAASGAAIGGLMGGVVGGAGAVNVSASRAAKINEERTKLGLNKIASSGSVDEAINAAAETVSQKPVTPKDIWDDQAARNDLLMRAEQINQQKGVQNEAQVQGTETPAAETNVLDAKSAETLLNQAVSNDRLNSISSTAQLDKDASESDIIAQNLGNAAKGAATEIILLDNTTLPAEWMVVDADNVKATMKNGINQPRDRTRAAADVQIQQIANQPDYRRMSDSPVMDIGAPTLDSSGAIVGGNGRFEGVSRGYDAGTSAAYRAALEADAVKKGIDPATFAGMKKPVLVRRVTQPFDTQKLAVASNSGGSLEYSALERAKIDAERIGDIDQIDVTDSGDIALTKDNAANIRNALKGYGASELGSFVDNEGNLSQEGSRRLKNAILYSAYGNSKTLSRMVESTDTDMRNIVGALTKTAGQAARVRKNISQGGLPKSLDITDNLIEAVEKIGQIRSSGDTVDNYLNQGELFSDIALSEETKEIMTGLSDVMRSQKRMTEFLRATYDLIEKVDVTTENIFGEPDIPKKLEVVKHAKKQTAEQRPGSLFGEETGTEPAAKINNVTSIKESAKYSRSPEERLKDRERSRKLERALRQQGYNFAITPKDVRDFASLDRGRENEAIAAERIARIFRKRITWIEAKGDFDVNGITLPSIQDTIFIDVDTDKYAHAVMGHELSHHMEHDVPEVYSGMVDALTEIIPSTSEYAKKYGIKGVDDAYIIKEIVGDIMGDNFTQPEFWNKVAAYNPNAFRKIADTIISWIKRLVINAKARGLGSEQWVTDAQKAQDIVAKAVAQYTPNLSAPAFGKKISGSIKPDTEALSGVSGNSGDFDAIQSSLEVADKFIKSNSAFFLRGKVSPSEKDKPDSVIADSEVLANISESAPIIKHGFGGLDIPSKRVMFGAMSRMLKNSEVRNLVIESVPIDVMNMLTGGKIPPDVLFHDMPMLFNLLSINGDKAISASRNATSETASVIASMGAKAAILKVAASPNKLSPALLTRKGNSFSPALHRAVKNFGGFESFIADAKDFSAVSASNLGHNYRKFVEYNGDYNTIFDDKDVEITAKFSKKDRQNTKKDGVLLKKFGKKAEFNNEGGLILHHGSDAAIKNYSLSKVGTPTEGWGVYFSTSKTNAKAFGKVISDFILPSALFDQVIDFEERLSNQNDYVRSQAGKLIEIRDSLDDLATFYFSWRRSKLATYGNEDILKVVGNHKDGIGRLSDYLKKMPGPRGDVLRNTFFGNSDPTGGELYMSLSEGYSGHDKAASKRFLDVGIIGAAFNSSRDLHSRDIAAKNVMIWDQDTLNNNGVEVWIGDAGQQGIDKDIEITAKFSREQSEKNLYVAHNLTAENIRHANEIGGLAAPSLAVAKTGKGFSGFGEITLIAKPDLLKTSKVRTFDSDVYTPRHPRAVHKINRSKYDRFVESLGDVQGLDIPNIEELASDSGIEAITSSPGVQYHWLSTQQKQPAVKPKSIDPDTMKIVKLMRDNGLVREWHAEQNEKVMNAVNAYVDRKIEEFRGRIEDRLGEVEEGNLRRNYKNNILLSASSYIESGGKDLSRLKSEVTEKISRNKKLENDFKVYVLGQFNRLVDEKRIFKGFTPAGKRKYIPYDMDNIIKEMTRTLRAGEDFFYGAGNIRAAFAKEFRNISEIQADRDRIVSPDEMEKIKDDAQNKVSNAIEELKPYYRYEKDSINYYRDAAQAIAEGRKGQNEAFKLDDDARKIIDDLTNYLRHLPTEYFEAKAQRPVSFSEFESAVVPKGAPKDVINILKESGLSVVYYTRGDEQSRSEAVKKSAEKKDALFSRATPIPDTITIDGKERPTRNSNGGLIHPTEEGIRNFWEWFGGSKTTDGQGRPLVVYHGTQQDFTTFDVNLVGSNFAADERGFFFSSNPQEAAYYAESDTVGLKTQPGGVVLPALIAAKKPFIVTPAFLASEGMSGLLGPGGKEDTISFWDTYQSLLLEWADEKGADSIILEDTSFVEQNGEPRRLVVAFNSNQIKSATGNTGQFSPDSDDIRFSRASGNSKVNKYLSDYKGIYSELLSDDFIKNNDFDAWASLRDKAVGIRNAISDMLDNGDINGLGVDGDALLSRNSNGSKNAWRITYFDDNGNPNGHSEYVDAKNAVSDFLNPSRSNKVIALFSRSDTLSQAGVNTEEAAKPSSLPEETKTQAFRRRSQDAMLRFKVVQNWLKEQGVNLSEAANVYQRENISKGKTANRIEDFRREQLEPLIKRIAETSKKATGEGKFDLADIATYLEAVHIPEANERMRTIHKDDKATANGITDDQARKVVKQFESMPNFAEFKKLADDVRKIGIDTLDMRLEAGLISQDQYDAYKSTYKNWVPLRGNMSKQGFGKGMSTNAKDKRRMGHGFREEEFVIENLVQDRERAIMQIEKNKIGMTVAQFLMEAENPNIGTIDKPEKMRVMKDFSYAVTFKGRTVGSFETEAGARNAINKIMDRKGDLLPEGESFTQTDFNIDKSYDPHIVMMARPQLAENEIQVYVNGHAVRLQLNDTGLARAATNAGIEQVGAIAHGARMFNRFLSKAYTAWSPDFLFMNMARDAYSGTLVLTGKKGAAFAAKTFTNYGTAVRELIKGRNDPKQSEWVTRYRAAGGNIGAAYLSDIERVGEDALAALQEFAGARETYRMVYNEQISKGSSPAKARTMAALKAGVAKTKAAPVVGHLFKTLERVNMVIENALRLATFKTAIESGESDQQAAMLSKDLMNFNRKGEMANQMGALYLFYNPGMQGAHIVGEALFTSKHRKQVWALLGALTTLSFILAEFARGGEDDDDREWENTPDYIKDRNLIFQFGDKQITVPVAYGFGIFHAMGNYLSDLNHGADKSEIAVKLASGMFENFSVFGNPIVGDDGDTEIRMDQILPTLPKLIMAPGINMDSLGRQIHPTKYQDSVPDSQLMWRSVRGTAYEDIAHFMNDITGGSQYNPGAIDISPNTIKYWVTALTGGAGRFVSDITTGGLNAAEGIQPEIENVPVLRKFIREPGVNDSRGAFHKARKEAQTAAERAGKALRNGDMSEYTKMMTELQPIIDIAKYARDAQKMASMARDEIMRIQLDKDMSKAEKKLRIKEIELQEQRVYDQFLSAFDVAKEVIKK